VVIPPIDLLGRGERSPRSGVVTRKETLAGRAFAGKRLLVVGSLWKQRALFAAVARSDLRPVVHAETTGLGLVNAALALAVVHVHSEQFKGSFDAFLGGFEIAVRLAVFADRESVLLCDARAVVAH
jgi:hypothetical protein